MRWRAFLLAALLRLAATALVYTAGVDRAPWRVQPQLDADHSEAHSRERNKRERKKGRARVSSACR